MIVKHQAAERRWLSPFDINKPRTLVLGSFNPYNPNDQRELDYYYGRSTNHFWRTIANILGAEAEYFFDQNEGINRKGEAMNNRFCCLDVIDEVEFSSNYTKTIDDYLKDKIFCGFLDQDIWVSTKRKEYKGLSLRRKYNTEIKTYLQESTTINRVIHTMGQNRITLNSAYPVELKMGSGGFNNFIREIIKTCKEKNIEFVYKSLSPSDYAVKTGKTDIRQLKQWLNNNLFI